jgi:hypothetical protein
MRSDIEDITYVHRHYALTKNQRKMRANKAAWSFVCTMPCHAHARQAPFHRETGEFRGADTA